MTKALKIRKIVLLALCAFLLAVCIVQCVQGKRDNTRVFNLKGEPDEILISRQDETITLRNENGKWLLGDQSFTANATTVDSIIRALSSIKTLGKVGRASADNLNRYELNEGQSLSVTAKKDGAVVRSLELGKNSVSSSQSFVLIDGSEDIYLASGNLRGSLDRSSEDLRSNIVIDLEKSSITAVSVTGPDARSWALSRTMQNGTYVWSLSGADVSPDAEKAGDWLESLSLLSASAWLDDGNAPEDAESLASVMIYAGEKSVRLDLYYSPETEEEEEAYYGLCSEVPYAFELLSYSAQKFLKNAEDFAK